MTMKILTSAALVAATLLSACGQTLVDGVPLIAIPNDRGWVDTRDNRLVDGEAGIAYDPDGCQVWLIDDGVEGYSGRRVDPATGLPVCNGEYPPGSIIGPYKTNNVPEWLPIQ